MPDPRRIVFRPLTPARWDDLVALFGPRGACGGCWCMWWKLPRSQFQKRSGAANRRSFRRIVREGPPPGLLAYVAGRPAGWCAVAPREAYPVLDRSRILKRIDDRPVWSITCFFIAKEHRRRGLTGRLIEAAVRFAARRGARIVEAYPTDPGSKPVPDVFAYTGLSSSFRKAGFVESARRSPRRPVMRYSVPPSR